jgi:hypothetical protein
LGLKLLWLVPEVAAFVRNLILFLSLVVSLTAAPSSQSLVRPLTFEPNVGQAPPEVKWVARGNGYQLYLTSKGAVFVPRTIPKEAMFSRKSPSPSVIPTMFETSKVDPVTMSLPGSRAWRDMEGLEPIGAVNNYLIGKDSSQWHTGVPQYSRLRIANVYNGVDLVFYATEKSLEYDFTVRPGADPDQIHLAFNGASKIARDPHTGDLLVTANSGFTMRHRRPAVFQNVENQIRRVDASYVLLNQNEASFLLASYDRNKLLTIDPTVDFTTFLSGSGQDVAGALAVDNAGNSYVTGYTFSTNYPTVSPMQANFGGSVDAFVTKLSPSGAVLFSTYLGGSGGDFASAIAVDSNAIYVVGSTDSANFPSRDHRRGAGPKARDAFVTELSLAGNSLVATAFLGGSSTEYGFGVAVDPNHDILVVGTTYSNDFPVVNAYQPFFGSNAYLYADAFVAKLRPSAGLAVQFATYVGGIFSDEAYAVAVDNAGYAYVTGYTSSPLGFPATFGTFPGPLLPPNPNISAAYVAKFNPNGYIVNCALFGVGSEKGRAIAVNGPGSVYIAGETFSPDLFVSSGAFQHQKLSPTSNASVFVTRLDDPGLPVYSTYFSGSDGDTLATGISVQPSTQVVYVAGYTSSTTLPGAPAIVPNPTAGFVAKFKPFLTGIDYTQFLGAQINGFAVTQSTFRFPWMLSHPILYTAGYRFTGNNVDAFVVKLDESPVVVVKQF